MKERSASPNPLPAGPVPLGAWPQIVIGGTIFVLGLVGVIFFLAIPSTGSPTFLFLPIIVAAIGAPGLLIGLITLYGEKKD